MNRLLPWSLVLLVVSAAPAHASPSPSSSPVAEPPAVQVMILGAYHFANPGHDIHNLKVDDVTTPKRQAEMAEVATRLAKFRPTRVALEAQIATPDLVYVKYRTFKPADLLKDRDERVQIGFRIARGVGLAEVYGIDSDGDFPYDKLQAFAERTAERKARFAALMQQAGDEVGVFDALQKTQSIAASLAWYNEPARILKDQGLYNAFLKFGDTTAQPGADLNAAWYLRNARIFTRLIQIARPGDRVIVVFGAGHAYWLRHFVATTPGFQLVEPAPYLLDAKK